MSKEYYVYTHTSLEDDVVFYLGKGRANRAYSFKGRSKPWKVKSKSGYTVQILADNLTYEESEDFEARLLDDPHDDWKLVNIYKSRVPIKLLGMLGVKYDETSPTFLRWETAPFAGKRKVNGIAGTIGKNKYVSVMVDRVHLLAHRIIWVLHNNVEIPRGYVINHIDNDPSNNNINNLECITYAQNNRKKKNHKLETNGVFETTTCPQGVLKYYNATGSVTIDGKVVNKSFSYLKYGKEEAFRLACEWRRERIKELNEQGAGYTDRHGT